MVINREFFFRGWLPAGLVVNARLLSRSSSRGETVLKPVLNPIPGSHWSVYQPAPVFPVSQATDQTAILLRDPFPETALVMLPLEKWFGSGTPYVLALNTWYEGRIQEVTGEDVMAIRLSMTGANREYYSYYSDLDAPDVKLRALPCITIPGRKRNQCMMMDQGDLFQYELGFPPTVTMEGETMFAHIMEPIEINDMSIAGLMSAYASLSPGAERHFVQCLVSDGRSKQPTGAKYFGLATKVDAKVCPFYVNQEYMISGLANADALDAMGRWFVNSPSQPGESVVHYN